MSDSIPPPPPPFPPSGAGQPPPAPYTMPSTPMGTGWSSSGGPTGSGKALAAMILGLVSIVAFLTVVVPLLALVFGLLGARETKRSAGQRTGLGKARTGWILGLLGLVAAVLIWVAIGATVAGTTSVNDLEVGQCVELPDDGDKISRLKTFECTEPHDAEVFAVGDLGTGNDPYPGEDEVGAMIAAECIPAFESYVGAPYGESEFEVFPLSPTEELWDSDQGYICLAFDPGDDLTESIEGSDR